MFHALSIGASALRANQIALDVTGHNIANTNTEGYRRQTVHFSERGPTLHYGLRIGDGVDVSSITAAQDQALSRAVGDNAAALADVQARGDVAQRVETILTPGVGSLNARLQRFFNMLEQLSTRPTDSVMRAQVVSDASRLAQDINDLSLQLDGVANDVGSDLNAGVHRVNDLSRRVADLNRQIRDAKLASNGANELVGQRDQLAAELGKLVDVRVDHNTDTVSLGGGALTIGASPPPELEVNLGDNGPEFSVAGGPPFHFNGGSLSGLQYAANEFLPRYQGRLDDLAGGLVDALDGIHSTGAGLDGLRVAHGGRGVTDRTAPLADSAGPPAITAGDLYVGVTNTSTGERTLHKLSIDPATQSLDDLAGAISGIPHVQAVINSQTGELSIRSESGYEFDFTGRPASELDLSGLTGTAQPHISGVFDGAENTDLQFTFVGTGNVGVTPNLTLEVRNSAGDLLSVVDIGDRYEPGSSIDLANGLSLTLGAGSVVSGQTFGTPAVTDADTSNVLAGLGINTLFTGSNARDLAVHPDLLADPNRFTAARSDDSADTSNLLRLIDARDTTVVDERTLEQFAADIVGQIGDDVNGLDESANQLDLVGQGLQQQLDSATAVDPNEELVKMVQYQRSFQAAARFISTVDQLMDDLFRIL